MSQDVKLEEEQDEGIPCSWRYVALCYLLPITIGGLNGCFWGPSTFYFQAMGWDVTHVGYVILAGYLSRPLITRSYVIFGMWTSLPIAFLHLLGAILGLLFPTLEWAILVQIYVIVCLDIFAAAEALAFMTFGASERNAKIATGAVLQMSVIAYASSSSIGGILYDIGGWLGVTLYHVAVQASQVFLLAVLLQDELRKRCCGQKTVEQAEDPAPAGASKPTHQGDASKARRASLQSVQSLQSQQSPVAGRRGSMQSTESAAYPFAARRTSGSAESFFGAHSMPTDSQTTLVWSTFSCTSRGSPQAAELAARERIAAAKGGDEAPTPFPKDLYWPGLLVAGFSFMSHFTYQSEWSTFALYFKDVHGWNQATWSGLAQTAGDVLAAILMKVQNCRSNSSIDDKEKFQNGGCSWLLASTLGKPYGLSVIALCYSAVCFGMASPSLIIAITSQVLMGSVFLVAFMLLANLNTYYSLGDSSIFLRLQVMKQNCESVGSSLAGLSILIYQQLGPTAPFTICGSLFLGYFMIYTAGFCIRVGFGRSLDTAEEARSRKRGLERKISWTKGASKENLEAKGEQPALDVQVDVVPPQEDDDLGSTFSM